MTSNRRHALRILAILVFGALLAAFARNVDWRSAAGAVRTADRTLLVIALSLNLLSLAIKGTRWWIFLRRLGHVPFLLVLRATFAGASLNNLVVAQGGEGARVLLVARAAGVPSAGVLAALALERALDVVSYLVLLVGATWLLELPAHLTRWRAVAGIVLALAAGALVLLGAKTRHRESTRESPTRAGVASRLAAYVRRVLDGVALAASPGRLAAGMLLSLAAWSLQVATYHLTALALHLPLPLAGSIAALLAVGIGFLIRATPGNVGVFQVIYALAVRPFGIAEAAAVATALLIQTLQVVPTVVVGTLVAPRLARGTREPAE